jgi:hypothetical protein
MRGAIHGIWLVKPNGKLHPAIIPNLSTWAHVAAKDEFHVVLWTNINELAPAELAHIKASNIQIADPSACKDSPLYKYYEYFFTKGLKGDTTAFALASDVLRMAILDFTANDKYFIYVDPNDVKLLNLADNLQHLDSVMHNNKLGFSFPVGPVAANSKVFDIRNDVLIALKANNPNFFKDYLNAYWLNLEATYKKYKTPTTDAQAKLLATRISNDTSTLFFRLDQVEDNSINIVSQFGKYSESWQAVNSSFYLTHARVTAHGNTWLPVGASLSAQEELAINDTFINGLVNEQKSSKTQSYTIISKIINLDTPVIVISFTGLFCTLVIMTICYKIFTVKRY